MDLSTFELLNSPTGSPALAQARQLEPSDATLLACLTKLRKHYPVDLATAALETTLLRRKAAKKFSRAAEMFFTREALEQSSSEIVSRYRAERFAPFATVADLCCGIGGDAIGLAEQHRVIAIDNDPLRLAMARHNLTVYGYAPQVECVAGDVLDASLGDAQAAFADPDRRLDGKRRLSYHKYQPPLDRLLDRLPKDFPLGVKLAPGIAWEELDELDASFEFISVAGELKECVAYFGPLRTKRRQAMLLPDRVSLAADQPVPQREAVEPRAFLYDPDPAIVRSGLVTNLAEVLNAQLIDEQIAYLTADAQRPTPFATAYRIDEAHPFNLKTLNERLQALRVGEVTILKRGSAVDPNQFHRQLKLEGPERRVVILTRGRGRPIMLIGERC